MAFPVRAAQVRSMASVLCATAFSLLVVVGVCAQSTDVRSPTPVQTNEIVGTIAARDIGDARLTDYFYTFTGVPGDQGVEFHLSHGDWIRLLHRSGFEIEDLVELRPAPGATTRFPFVTVEWARQWPSEEVWKARKRP